jgi:hypothetical protein
LKPTTTATKTQSLKKSFFLRQFEQNVRPNCMDIFAAKAFEANGCTDVHGNTVFSTGGGVALWSSRPPLEQKIVG